MQKPSTRYRTAKLTLAIGAIALGLILAGCSETDPGPSADQVELQDKAIFVAGGSGRAGRYIVDRLDARNLNLTAMTRNKASAIERLGEAYADINWIEGDVRNAETIKKLLTGIDMVICVIGSRETEGPNGPEFVDYRGVANLVDAAVAADVEHFVLLTAIGVTDDAHPLNKLLGNALIWRFKGEQHLRQSGLTYTIVRPAGLVDEPAGEKGVFLDQGDNWRDIFRGTITRGDLAEVLIASLETTHSHNKTFEIVNRTDLEPGIWRQTFPQLLNDSDLQTPTPAR